MFRKPACQVLWQDRRSGNGAYGSCALLCRISFSVPAFHVLFAAFSYHKPGNIFCRLFGKFAFLSVAGTSALFLKAGCKNASVGCVFFIYSLFLFGKTVVPDLIFMRNKGFSYLVIHSAFISKVCIFALHSFGSFFAFLSEIFVAGLNINCLGICSNTNRLLSYSRRKTMESFFPCFIFCSSPSIFHFSHIFTTTLIVLKPGNSFLFRAFFRRCHLRQCQ